MRNMKIIVMCVVFLSTSQIAFALFCPQCGNKNADNTKYCINCGSLIKGGEVLREHKKNETGIKGHAYIALGSGGSNVQRGMKVFLRVNAFLS